MTKQIIVHCYVLVTWYFIHNTHAENKEFLFYSSPGGNEQNLPGLYGGYINPDNGGRAFDLQQVGIKCAVMPPTGFYGGLDIKGVSHDSYSNEVLLEIDEYADTQTSLIKGVVCQKNSVCDKSSVFVFFSTGSNTDQLQSAKLGPFARWKSDIYFVARRYREGSHPKERVMRMAVRKMMGCQTQYPFTTINPMDLDACSEEVALILEERMEDVVLVMRERQTPAGTLQVVDSGSDLNFLLQVQRQRFSEDIILLDYHMDLYAAKLHETTAPAHRLHEQPLPLTWTWHRLRNIGGIHYKHGLLCWSAIDRILCSKWKPGNEALNGVQPVLKPGMAANVCNGSGEFLPGVITGLAIAKESDNLSVYFGCMSQIRTNGGAGLLTLNADWSKGEINPLVDRQGRVLAGNMFLAAACDDMPLKEDDLQSDEASKEEKTPQIIEKPQDKLEVEPVQSVKGSASTFSLMTTILTFTFCAILESLIVI